MGDCVTWFGENETDYAAHEALQQVAGALGVTLDLPALHDLYFDRTPLGEGAVHVYQPVPGHRNLIAIDMYRDPADQLDIVTVAIRCTEECREIVKNQLRTFFDSAECQVGYEEVSYSPRLERMIDPENYPKSFLAPAYEQPIHYFYG